MFKVIVERPRRGHEERGGRCTQYPLRGEADYLPKQESIGKKYKVYFQGKELSENLNPLWRFFESKVGQRWDDVWSEVCEHLNSNSAVQKHVKDHAKQHVELVIFMVGNQPYYHPMFGRGLPSLWEPLYSSKKYKALYVNPETNILSIAPLKPPKERSKDWWKIVKCDDGSEHQWYDGVWYNVKKVTEKVMVREPVYGAVTDPETGKSAWRITGTKLVEEKRDKVIWRQLNKKDIKMLRSWFKGEYLPSFKKRKKKKRVGYINRK